MKILFVSICFPPDTAPVAARIHGLAKYLKRYGHDVTVVCGFPNYPHSASIVSGYKKGFWLKEQIDGIQVIRTYVYTGSYDKFTSRMLNYLSFTVSSFIGALMTSKPDVIIASSPPIFVGISAYLASRLMAVPYVFDVRDIWPDIVIKLGALTNSTFIKIAEGIERFCYDKASLITVVTNQKKNILVNRGIPSSKVKVISNGVDLESFVVRDDINVNLQLDDLVGKTVIMYVGNHGVAQGLGTILESAKLLIDKRNIIFVFIGEGTEKEKLVKFKEENHLDNVLFLSAQPKETIPNLLNLADICLLPLASANLLDSVPSKMFEYMALGKCILLSAEGESQNILEEAGAGIAVEPGNAHAMAEAIMKLCKDSELRRQYGNNGCSFVVEHFSRKKIAKELESVLLHLRVRQ